MRNLNVGTLLLAGLFICASAAVSLAQAPPSPSVAMTVTLPDGTSKSLTTHESGLATVTVGGRDYGFRPTMHDDQGTRMTITIFDMGVGTDATREVGSVDVKGGGPAVTSKTTPTFKVQARKASASATT